ncbi:MAG TPA: glycosyltransferase family 39 protein [Chthoniobacterales bacterium]|nr:glycosyltransferase family 39 protein [Chthoniobacterales bacterium]
MQPGVKNANRWLAVLLALALVAAGLCFVRITKNPPGFYIDESSVAYNAHTIARSGCDENGVRWPLYFRAFGDFKNPVYVYLLAGLFRLTGPSILVARLLSGISVVAAAVTLGWLALRLTRTRAAALLAVIFALITPWFFELGHVVMEVALYPLAIALFLVCVQRASEKERWGTVDVVSLAAALAVLTYSYSIGRLFAPFLALGLGIFWTKQRGRGVVAAWCVYAVLVSPIYIFSIQHPGALTERFGIVTYLNPELGLAETAFEFAKHYLRNLNPWKLLVRGDPNRDQIAHVFGTPHFLAPLFVFSLVGLALLVRRAKNEAWARFLLYGFAVAIVPASLTKEAFHMLRLIAVPVFLLVFAVEGVRWFLAKAEAIFWRTAFVLLLALTVAEAGWFQWKYQRTANTARRVHLFDAEYPAKIFAPAIASGANPIYLADALWIPGYIQAYWQATLQGIDLARFRRLPPDEAPPLGALMISTEENCPGCEILAAVRPYTLALAKEPPQTRPPLPPEGFRAELSVAVRPSVVRAKRQTVLLVRVKNVSSVTWLARERGGSPHQVSLGNHWLDSSGKSVINDDARSALLRDLKPGESVELPLTVNAPTPGSYLLEVDMLQEGVTWFGLVGSQTVKIPVEVR